MIIINEIPGYNNVPISNIIIDILYYIYHRVIIYRCNYILWRYITVQHRRGTNIEKTFSYICRYLIIIILYKRIRGHDRSSHSGDRTNYTRKWCLYIHILRTSRLDARASRFIHDRWPHYYTTTAVVGRTRGEHFILKIIPRLYIIYYMLLYTCMIIVLVV